MTDAVTLIGLQASQLRHELDAARAHAERLESIVESLVGVHRCSSCGDAYEYSVNVTLWRQLDGKWQHHCPETDPQAGYFDAPLFPGTLSRDLAAAISEIAWLQAACDQKGDTIADMAKANARLAERLDGTHTALIAVANSAKGLEKDADRYRIARDAALQARDDIYAAVGGQHGGLPRRLLAGAGRRLREGAVADLRGALAAAQENVGKVTATKDAAYHERDQVVAALAALASTSGWPVWLATHVGPWEDDWRNIVFIGTPYGQVSWHYHDSERDLFSMHKTDESKSWDGHSTAEKYERLSRLGDFARRAAAAQEPTSR